MKRLKISRWANINFSRRYRSRRKGKASEVKKSRQGNSLLLQPSCNTNDLLSISREVPSSSEKENQIKEEVPQTWRIKLKETVHFDVHTPFHGRIRVLLIRL